MIKYNLLCKKCDLTFDSWFASSKEFDKLKKKRKEEILKVLDIINPIIEEYIKNNSIIIVLDKKNIYIADTNYDISNILIELINNKIK